MPNMQQRLRNAPTWFRVVYFSALAVLGLLGLGLGVYWVWSQTGVFTLLAELQSRLFGGYLAGVTMLMTVCIGVLLCMAPMFSVPLIINALDLFAEGPTRAEEPHQPPVADLWLRRHAFSTVCLTLGVVFTVLGAYFLFSGATAGDLTRLDVAQLETGGEPLSRWVILKGRLLWDQALVVKERSGSPAGTHYVPMVSPQWRPGMPVTAFWKGDGDKRPANLHGEYEGTLTLGGLSGLLAGRFREAGLTPADNHVLLEYQNRPAPSA
jgi:hypothetical protein